MGLPALPSPRVAVAWFVVANLGFLGVDIFLAHAANGFADRLEWAPVAFSALAPLLLLPGRLGRGGPKLARALDLVVAWVAIVVGVAGMVLHLQSAFFAERTLRSLVYAAPFVAPLAYVGVGLLLLLLRIEPEGSPAFGPWVTVLALGGFVGNFVLSLLDHAQNGFFRATEWTGVIAAAFGAAFLLVGVLRPDPRYLRICLWVCAAEAAVGVWGSALHVLADARRSGDWLGSRLLYGAPVFAPLLFADIALLAALGLWATLRERPSAASPLPQD
jgi:hypothetical protein